MHDTRICMLRLLIAAILLLLPQAAWPTPTAGLQRLAMDPTWLKLIHYEPQHFGSSHWRSAIHSPEFFFAENGPTDPYAELLATIAALTTRDESISPNEHPQCRFPARALWLKGRLGEQLVLADGVTCPELDTWTRSNTVSSVSVVLATGYLGNPASYYGHTLLKLNFKDERHTRLMDVSVNYGAIQANNDDPLSYIAKGIFGGYEGGFSHIHYYFHNHNYGENELRDLWEYQLDLPQSAVDLIVAHAWEVLGKRYTYYFFRRNCAYRMAELLQIVEGIDVMPENRPWTIPQSLIQKIGKAQLNGQPLVGNISYQPSRQSRLYARYQSLDPSENQLLEDLVNERAVLTDTVFTRLSLESRQAILDTLLDYYQFIRDSQAGDADPANERYRQILALRYQLESGASRQPNYQASSPHMGRAPGWFQLGLSSINSTSDAMLLRVRPAYYDVLDTDSGHVSNAALSMGDISLRITQGKIRLRRLDAIAIESVNPALTGLPGDRGSAWNLRLGVEPLRLDCTSCLVTRFQGDMGYGRQLSNSLFGAAYLGGALQEDRLGYGFGYAKASTRLIYRPSQDWSMRIGYEHRQPLGSRRDDFSVIQTEIRRATGKDSDLRISYEKNAAHELTLGVGIYW